MDLTDGNQQLSTRVVFYKTYKEKFIECYADASFDGEWYQEDSNNLENIIFHTRCVITYANIMVQ